MCSLEVWEHPRSGSRSRVPLAQENMLVWELPLQQKGEHRTRPQGTLFYFIHTLVCKPILQAK